MKAALVSGASRGIGAAIATALAAKGFALGLAAEGTPEELAEVAEACRAAGAPQAVPLLFDLSRPDMPEAMVAAALAALGRIDVLVNNAGIRCRKPFGTFTRADYATLFGIDFAAAFFASQAVLPAMRAQGQGRIIHIASQMGRVAAEENALYGPAKAALIQLTKNMAFELAGENIQVNSVSPGPIATRFNIESYGRVPGRMALMTGRVPAGRFGTEAEVGEVVAFLATSEGSYIQGHDLVVDGGYVIH